MKKNIDFRPVEGVNIAIVRRFNISNVAEWEVVLINNRPETISQVFVTSKGYGDTESGSDFAQKTSTLRHFYQEIEPKKHVIVEPILKDLFHLYNEYWISFFVENQLFDKKFVFVPDSIVEENIIKIELLGLEGVIHE